MALRAQHLMEGLVRLVGPPSVCIGIHQRVELDAIRGARGTRQVEHSLRFLRLASVAKRRDHGSECAVAWCDARMGHLVLEYMSCLINSAGLSVRADEGGEVPVFEL